ncbi:MAG: ABC transporter substrate-binding protein [bacterium]|jgi:iron complex transport system substrate-binding protein
MAKRLAGIIILLLLMATLGAGCTGQPSAGAPGEDRETIKVVDSFGREVSVPADVERIAALYSFAGYAVSLLGRGGDLVAVPGGLQRDNLLVEMIPPIAGAAVPRTSGKINIEELMRVKPDVAIIRGDTAADAKEIDKLNTSGIPYLIVEFSTMAEQQEAIRIIGRAIGRAAEAAAYNEYYNGVLRLVEDAVTEIPPLEKARVYHSENQATRTIHKDSLAADWSKAAGIINVSIEEDLNLIENDYYCSLEQVLLWDPEVIIANENAAVAYIRGNPQWSGIKAVRNNRVYQLPLGISRWGHPGSIETPLAVLWTAKTVYPGLLPDVDMKEEVKAYYRRFFAYELSDATAEQILSGEGMREPKHGGD